MTQGSTTSSAIDDLLHRRSILVCVGPGGVGKTTTSAALALRAAATGRKVLVLTVDPAKRLADSLGLEGLLAEPTRVPLETLPAPGGGEPGPAGGPAGRGELWAMMLDTKRTFDQVIERHAPTVDARDRILQHPFYQQLSTALAGSQEYMAMEKLFELRAESTYDLIILDTPPTQHALDFLDAPRRMEDFFENSALKALVRGGGSVRRFGAGLFKLNALILKGVGRFVGADVFLRILEFVEALAGLSTGFAQRAREVQSMLRGPGVGVLVISSPDETTMVESLHFYERLSRDGLPLDGVVLNRVRERFGPASYDRAEMVGALTGSLWAEPALRTFSDVELRSAAEVLADNLLQFEALAARDESAIESLRRQLAGESTVIPIPYFAQDIHDLSTLASFAAQLVSGSAY